MTVASCSPWPRRPSWAFRDGGEAWMALRAALAPLVEEGEEP